MTNAVDIACEELTDGELNSLYMAVLLERNPTRVQGYSKIEALFSDDDDGTRMHQTTRDAFAAVWEQRCGKKEPTE